MALVLSGGGALGIAHVGVLKAIERLGIPVDMVLGTSMGSLVGGLYAAGYSPDQMESLVEGLDWNALLMERRDSPGDRYEHLKRSRFPLRLGFDRRGLQLGMGLIHGQNVLTLFTGLTLHALPRRDFDALPVPYRAVAADIIDGSRFVFSSGSLAEAMRSSMSIPGVFAPYRFEGRSLVDGGIADNMPVDLARAMGADIVIAVESRTHLARDPAALRSALSITGQTLNLFVEENMRPSRAAADLLIVPDLSGYNAASFVEAEALVSRGEFAADRQGHELRALASRIAATRPLLAPDSQSNRRAMAEPPFLESVRVEGGQPADEASALQAFGPLAGRAPARAEVTAAIDTLYGTGRYDLVTFDLAPGSAPGRAAGIVRLVPDRLAEDYILLSGLIRGLFSAYSSSEAGIAPGILARDLTGKDSALFAEAALGSWTRAYIEFMQPFGPFFLMPWARFDSRYDGIAVGDSLGLRALFRSLGGGTWAGLTLGRHADFMAGWSWEDVKTTGRLGNGFVDGYTVGAAAAAFRLDTRPGPVFPERGLFTLARARWADPLFGGSESFVTTEWLGGVELRMGKNLALGLSAFAGTDFAGFAPVPGSLPPERYFSIRQPGMFYGLESRPPRGIGNSVLAAAAELRARMGALSPLLGGEIYGIVNLSAGGARDIGDGSVDFLPPRLCASAGLGLRISQGLGLQVMASLVSDQSDIVAPLRPALSVELGGFGAFLEDLR